MRTWTTVFCLQSDYIGVNEFKISWTYNNKRSGRHWWSREGRKAPAAKETASKNKFSKIAKFDNFFDVATPPLENPRHLRTGLHLLARVCNMQKKTKKKRKTVTCLDLSTQQSPVRFGFGPSLHALVTSKGARLEKTQKFVKISLFSKILRVFWNVASRRVAGLHVRTHVISLGFKNVTTFFFGRVTKFQKSANSKRLRRSFVFRYVFRFWFSGFKTKPSRMQAMRCVAGAAPSLCSSMVKRGDKGIAGAISKKLAVNRLRRQKFTRSRQ